MKKRHLRNILIGATLSASALLIAGCSNNAEDPAATPSGATASGSSTNVPAAAQNTGQGAQQMGNQMGQDNASKAAAWRAAREKAEGRR